MHLGLKPRRIHEGRHVVVGEQITGQRGELTARVVRARLERRRIANPFPVPQHQSRQTEGKRVGIVRGAGSCRISLVEQLGVPDGFGQTRRRRDQVVILVGDALEFAQQHRAGIQLSS